MQLEGSVRLFRRKTAADPYTHGSAGAVVPTKWESADVSTLEGAWVDERSVVPVNGDDRVGSLTFAVLLVEAGADVRKGDGVSRDPAAVRPEFVLDVVPFVPLNPFTGWSPLIEVPLRGAQG